MAHTAAVSAWCQTSPVKAPHEGYAALTQLLGAPSKRFADDACVQSCKRAKLMVDEREVQHHVQQQLLRARVTALVQALHTTCV